MSKNEPLEVYWCLVDPHRKGHATAPAELASLVLGPLVLWLTQTNPRVDPHIITEAADEAVLALIRNPDTFRPDAGGLESYLQMSAEGDLRNILRREQRHRKNRLPWEVVELSEDLGNYMQRDDDPSFPLSIEEELERLQGSVPAVVRDGLAEGENRVLDLMLREERSTAVYADAYGVADRPPEEQRKIIKRVKDKLLKRIERAEAQ